LVIWAIPGPLPTNAEHTIPNFLLLASVSPYSAIIANHGGTVVSTTQLVNQCDERQEQGDHDTTNDNSQETDHNRFNHGGHGFNGTVDFFFIYIGNAVQHLR